MTELHTLGAKEYPPADLTRVDPIGRDSKERALLGALERRIVRLVELKDKMPIEDSRQHWAGRELKALRWALGRIARIEHDDPGEEIDGDLLQAVDDSAIAAQDADDFAYGFINKLEEFGDRVERIKT